MYSSFCQIMIKYKLITIILLSLPNIILTKNECGETSNREADNNRENYTLNNVLNIQVHFDNSIKWTNAIYYFILKDKDKNICKKKIIELNYLQKNENFNSKTIINRDCEINVMEICPGNRIDDVHKKNNNKNKYTGPMEHSTSEVNEKNNGLNTALIISGIAIVILVILVYLFIRRCNQRRNQRRNQISKEEENDCTQNLYAEINETKRVKQEKHMLNSQVQYAHLELQDTETYRPPPQDPVIYSNVKGFLIPVIREI
ncbi:uncharacterized protein LOC113515729 isoform X2 [Galleria mellonella]|uniref:Uncharacterized protein LOC113515729 isoform X2 n=1 Tax=Galleria mellonella TaxID=7137 RepID=A0A6J3BW93_GALME|nr:uncharacterized protein LOC113515729 isoform X2 [Galleria mellonella]